MCQCISNTCSGCGGKDGWSCTVQEDCSGYSGGPGSHPPGPPSCFQAGTNITTTDGIKSIEDIKVGDKVKSYDIENKNITESEVYETFEHKDISDGLLLNGIIKTTTNHPFYSNGEWVEAGNLKIGDKILHVDGEEHVVNSIEPLNYSTTVYNFEVKDTHNYFAEGYLVHNKDQGGGDRTIIGQDSKDKQQMSTGPGSGLRPRRPMRSRSNMTKLQNEHNRMWNMGYGDTPEPKYGYGGMTSRRSGRAVIGGNQLMSEENCCACLRGRAGVVCDKTTCTCHEFLSGDVVTGGSSGGGNTVMSNSCDCMYNPNASPQYQCSGGCSNAGNSCGPSGGNCYGGGGTGGGGGGGGGGSSWKTQDDLAPIADEDRHIIGQDEKARMGGRIRNIQRRGVRNATGMGFQMPPNPSNAWMECFTTLYYDYGLEPQQAAYLCGDWRAPAPKTRSIPEQTKRMGGRIMKSKYRHGGAVHHDCPDGYTGIDEFGNNIC